MKEIRSGKMRHLGNIKAVKTLFLVMIMDVIGVAPAAAEVIVIANKGVPVDSISGSTLKEIYLGKKTLWNKKMKIAPSLLKKGKTHDDFLKKYIGKTAAQFRSYWNNLLFTGAGTPPPSFNTEKELVDYVAKTDGAIGYIDSGTPHDKVKAITVK